jgi:hypothetical protein
MHIIDDAHRWPCVREQDLCNGVADCPNADDEHPTFCLFHLAVSRGEEISINNTS